MIRSHSRPGVCRTARQNFFAKRRMRDQSARRSGAHFRARLRVCRSLPSTRQHMKKLIHLGAALAALCASLDAQSLTVTAPGYSGVKLFDSTPGHTITGLAADTNGDVYYLETDGSFSANTQLFK